MLTQSLGMYNVKLYFNLSFVCIVPVGEGRRVFRTVWREHIVRKGAFWVRVNVAYGCISLPSLFWGSTGWWGLINRGKQQIERRYEIPTGCKKGLLEEKKKKTYLNVCSHQVQVISAKNFHKIHPMTKNLHFLIGK